MSEIVGLLVLVWFAWWIVRLLIGLSKAGASAYTWARGLGKDTITLLEEADPAGEESGRLKMAVCFIRLALLVAAADGEVSAEELECIQGFFRRHGADDTFMSFVVRVLREAARDIQYEKTVSVVREVAQDKDTKLYLCAGLLEVAGADGHVDEHELGFILGVMEGIGFSETERVEFVRSMFSEPEENARAKAMHTLGLDEDATKEEVKKAYRQKAAKYHPDKHAHLGPEFADVAHKKFIEVKDAYEVLTSP